MSAPGKPTEQARALRRVAVAVAIACTISLPGSAEAQRLQFTKLTADDGLSGPWVPTVYQDSRGFMWFGTRRGLDRYDGYTITNYRNVRGDSTSLPDNYIEFAREDRDSVLWIGTRKGLSRFDRAHDRFITYRVGPGDEGRLVLSFLHTQGGTELGRHGRGALPVRPRDRQVDALRAQRRARDRRQEHRRAHRGPPRPHLDQHEGDGRARSRSGHAARRAPISPATPPIPTSAASSRTTRARSGSAATAAAS